VATSLKGIGRIYRSAGRTIRRYNSGTRPQGERPTLLSPSLSLSLPRSTLSRHFARSFLLEGLEVAPRSDDADERSVRHNATWQMCPRSMESSGYPGFLSCRVVARFIPIHCFLFHPRASSRPSSLFPLPVTGSPFTVSLSHPLSLSFSLLVRLLPLSREYSRAN